MKKFISFSWEFMVVKAVAAVIKAMDVNSNDFFMSELLLILLLVDGHPNYLLRRV
tara:strand:- start:778 stop:942 length:165 start_codon:yes stop_codon:yes gene_type:complete